MKNPVIVMFLIALVLTSCDDPISPASKAGSTPPVATAPAPASHLAALSVSTGALTPAFDPNVLTYTLSVPNSVTSVSLVPTPASGQATVVQSGGTGLKVGANTATNTVTVTVTGPDGTKTVYSVVVNRDIARTSNSGLKSLTFTAAVPAGLGFVPTLSPAFSPTTTSYTAVLPHSATSIALVAAASDSAATVSAQTGGTSLVDGVNPTVSIKVTSSDGTTTTTYTVTVDRWPFDVGLPSGDSTLSALTAAITPAGTVNISPTFSPGITTYTIAVPAATTAVALTPVAAAGATLSVSMNVTTPVTVSGSGYSVPILANTSTTAKAYTPVKLTVTAPDGTLSTVYNVMIAQDVSGGTVLSSDSSLSTLSLKAAGKSYALSPTFASGTTAYSVSVPAGTTSVTVSSTRTSAAAQSTVVTGATGLVTGANTVNVTVTAQDGSSTTYSILVNVPSSLSSVSTLSSLSVAGATLSPAFAAATTAYTLTGVAAGTTSLAVTATASATGGSVVTTGNTGLVVGSNTISVVCTAPDGVTKTTYTLSVTIAASGGGGGTAFSSTAKLTVSATYGGKDHAAFWIWISDASGAYIETLSLYGQGGVPKTPPSGGLPSVWTTAKGSTAAATNNGVDAVTAATWATSGGFVATHSQPWTFKNSAGAAVLQGSYTVHIEVHEQNGPGGSYSLPVTLGGSAVTQNFTPNAVLSAGSVTYTP